MQKLAVDRVSSTKRRYIDTSCRHRRLWWFRQLDVATRKPVVNLPNAPDRKRPQNRLAKLAYLAGSQSGPEVVCALYNHGNDDSSGQRQQQQQQQQQLQPAVCAVSGWTLQRRGHHTMLVRINSFGSAHSTATLCLIMLHLLVFRSFLPLGWNQINLPHFWNIATRKQAYAYTNKPMYIIITLAH